MYKVEGDLMFHRVRRLFRNLYSLLELFMSVDFTDYDSSLSAFFGNVEKLIDKQKAGDAAVQAEIDKRAQQVKDENDKVVAALG